MQIRHASVPYNLIAKNVSIKESKSKMVCFPVGFAFRLLTVKLLTKCKLKISVVNETVHITSSDSMLNLLFSVVAIKINCALVKKNIQSLIFIICSYSTLIEEWYYNENFFG
jgi:hypothetical protein